MNRDPSPETLDHEIAGPLTELEPSATRAQAARSTGGRLIDALVRSLLPVLLALVAGGVLLKVIGVDPLSFYGEVANYGLIGNGWQRSLILMAPLLLVATGLIVVFRANLWNLGYEGQYLLGAVVAVGFAPTLTTALPLWLAFLVLALGASVVAASWTIVPSVLKARYGTNEIITTLMMSFIAIGVVNLLIRGPFHADKLTVPQTQLLDAERMLPHLPGTKIHVGFLVAIVVALGIHLLLTRTSFGLRVDIFGASPRTALHVGIDVPWMIVVLFLISGALIGLAGAVDSLGLWGYIRANWNPAYGAAIMPFVFLGRLNVLATIPFVAFYAVLATGGAIASQDVGLPVDFLLVIIALILLFMTLIEFFGTRRDLGESYLPRGLRNAWRRGSRTGGAA